MAVMWWSFAALCLLAAVFISYSWVCNRGRVVTVVGAAAAAEAEDQANIRLYQEHLYELELQLEREEINLEQFSQLKLELERGLLIDHSGNKRGDAVAVNPVVTSQHLAGNSPWLVVVLVVALSAGAFAIYRHMGASQDLEILDLLERATQSDVIDNPELLAEFRRETLSKVNQRLQEDPTGYFYLVLAARLYSAENQHDQALLAYRKALLLSPEDMTILEEALQAAYLSSKGRYSVELRQITDQILFLEPNHLPVLGLSARLAMENGDHQRAIREYSGVLKALPPEHDTAQSIREDIKAAKQALAARGEQVEPESGAAEPAAPPVSITVSISMAEGLNAESGATLFVIARKPNVKGPPLAAKRLLLAELPMLVSLDDSNTMLPGTSLQDSDQLELVARISRSGSPIKQAGDLQGSVLMDTTVGQSSLDLTISEQVN